MEGVGVGGNCSDLHASASEQCIIFSMAILFVRNIKKLFEFRKPLKVVNFILSGEYPYSGLRTALVLGHLGIRRQCPRRLVLPRPLLCSALSACSNALGSRLPSGVCCCADAGRDPPPRQVPFRPVPRLVQRPGRVAVTSLPGVEVAGNAQGP